VADDQRLLMGETAGGQGGRVICDGINGGQAHRVNRVASTGMQSGTMVVQNHGGALHQVERGGRQKATRRTWMGAGGCKVQGARKRLRSQEVWGTAATVRRGGRTLGGDRTGRSTFLHITRFNCLTLTRCTPSLSLRGHMVHAVQDRSNRVSHDLTITHLHARRLQCCRNPLDLQSIPFLASVVCT
jgi:hypothetical protein